MKSKLFLIFTLFLFVTASKAQLNGNLFKWQGNISSSWSNSLNWQIWDMGTSSWVVNSLATIPNSTTHTVTIDYASATTKTVNVDVSTGNADVGQIFIINNAPAKVRFEIKNQNTLSVYNTFSVSGVNTNSISIYCSSASCNYKSNGLGSGLSGGGVIVFKPAASNTISPIFASATFSNVGIAVNGLGTTDITENNLTVQGLFHQLGTFNLVGKTFNSICSVQFEPINISSDAGYANLLGSTINTQNLLLANTALYNFATQTTTINLNGANTIYNSVDVLYNGNTLSASVSTVGLINIIGNKPSNFNLSGTTNCSKNVLINNLTTSEELIFNSNGGVCEYHIKNFNLTKPLVIRSISIYNTFKDLETITTAPSSCAAAYHFISQNDLVDISTNVPVNVNNLSFFNAKVSSGSIVTNGGCDMGYNSGVTFIAAPTLFGSTTLTWNGSADDKWTNPLNWTPNCVPTILTNVIIPSGTPNQANLVTSSGICYHFNSTGSPTVSIYNNMTLIVGGNFIRNTGTIFNLAPSVGTQANINISLIGIAANTTYSITSNNCLLPNYALNINANQNGTTYQLTDKFSVNYPGNNNSNFLNLITGRLFSNGFGIETKGLVIKKNNLATSTRSLNIANSIINFSNYNIGSPLYIDCSNTNEFNTTNSSMYFYNNPNVPTDHLINVINLPANNHLANPSFSLNRVIFESHPTNVGKINISAAGANTSLASGFKVNSVKALGGLVLSANATPKNLLNVDSLYLTGGFSLIGQVSNSITVNKAIISSANCQIGAFSLMSSNVGAAATNQFYINTGPSFSFTPLDYWNINSVRVNQGTGGVPAITVNNANLNANSGVSPSNGWNINAYVPKVYYWVGEGVSTNWTDIDNWSYSIPTNGDEPTAGCIPTIYDDVLFTKLSFFGSTGSSVNTTSVVMVDNTVNFKDMRWLGPFNTTTSGSTPLYPIITNTIINNEMNVSGSIRMHQTMKWNFGNTSGNNNNVRFTSTINDTIEMQNNSFGSDIYFNGTGRYVVLDSLVLSGVRTNTLNPLLLPGVIVHQNGELDLEGHKLFACGYQSAGSSASVKRKFNIANSKLNFIQIAYGGTIFGSSIAGTYTLNATNSIINIKPYNDYCCSGIHNTYLGLVTPTSTVEPRLNFNVINISSFSPSNTVYKVEASGKGVDIDSLMFDVSNTFLYNTVPSQTNTINYLKYKVGSTNQLTSGATTLLKELDSKSVCDPITIQSSIVGSYANICPSGTVALQASQTSLKYINSACGSYVSPNYNMSNGSLSSFIPNGSENTYGWSISTTASPLGFISQKTGTTTCSQLPFTINANEFNASITSHTLIWQSASGSYTGTPANGIDLTTFTTTANGVHTLTVIYKPGCSVKDTYTLNINNDVTSVYSTTNVICNGNSNGSFSVSPITGSLTSGNYNYFTSPGSYTSNAISSMSIGVYSYTVTNTINPSVCKSIESFTISEPNILQANVVSTNSISCISPPTGSITTNITGGNGGNIYNWSNGTTTYTTQNITSLSPGSYSLIVTDSKNCITNTVVTISSYASPTVSIGSISSLSICLGYSSTITPSGAANYTLISGSSTLTTSPFVVSPSANTIYTITGSSSVNCQSANTVTANITVNSNPTITTSGGTSSTLCSGDSFTINPSGGTGSYTLTNTGATSATNFIVTPSSNTTYTVIGANSSGCISPASSALNVSLTVNSTPTVAAVFSSNALCSSQNVTITLSGANSNYTLNPGNTIVPAGTASAVVSPTSGTTVYTITANNSNGCITTFAQQIYTTSVSVVTNPTITASAITNSICAGGTASITPFGATIFTVINSANATTYTLASGQTFTDNPSGPTTYTINGTATGGCFSTPSTQFVTTIGVNSNPTVTAISALSNTICTGLTTTLTASGATSYTWSGGPSTPDYTVSPNSTTVYTVIGTNSAGCSNSSVPLTLTVNVLSSPTLAIATSINTNTLCSGNNATITLGGASAGSTYTLFPGGSTSTSSFIVNPTSTQVYTVAAIDNANGCLSSTSSQVYTATLTVSTSPTISLSSASPSSTICSGQSVTIAVSGGVAGTYTLINNPLATEPFVVSPNVTTTYTISGAGSNGCISTASSDLQTTITVNQSPTIALVSVTPSQTLCAGQSATINVTGAAPNSYTLQNTNSTNTPFIVTPSVSTTYTISGSSSNGCLSSFLNDLIISINVGPSLSVSTIIQTITCNGGNNGIITASVSTTNAYTYLWSNGLTTGSINNLTAGSYSLTITDISNCKAMTSAMLIEPDPINVMEQKNTSSCDNMSTGSLIVNVIGGTPNYSITWSDGNTGASISQLSSGVISATITDSNGCMSLYNTTVNEEMCIETFIPELISPNGDGKNEPFMINSISYYPNNKLEIFNRWGGLVYTKEKYDNTFNGKANMSNSSVNGLLPAGTYFVVFDFGDGKTEPYHGFLEIKY